MLSNDPGETASAARSVDVLKVVASAVSTVSAAIPTDELDEGRFTFNCLKLEIGGHAGGI